MELSWTTIDSELKWPWLVLLLVLLLVVLLAAWVRIWCPVSELAHWSRTRRHPHVRPSTSDRRTRMQRRRDMHADSSSDDQDRRLPIGTAPSAVRASASSSKI